MNCPIHGSEWCTCKPEPAHDAREAAKVLPRLRAHAEEAAFRAWWPTFQGSSHDAEATARAAFNAGYRASTRSKI